MDSWIHSSSEGILASILQPDSDLGQLVLGEVFDD